MTTIREKENELFERWKNNCENFIPDGVVNETMWNTATRKIRRHCREQYMKSILRGWVDHNA